MDVDPDHFEFDFTSDKLPRGIWYEAERNRYRVRLYQGNKAYLAGYYKTIDDALEAWKKLKKYLRKLRDSESTRIPRVTQPTAKALVDYLRDN